MGLIPTKLHVLVLQKIRLANLKGELAMDTVDKPVLNKLRREISKYIIGFFQYALYHARIGALSRLK